MWPVIAGFCAGILLLQTRSELPLPAPWAAVLCGLTLPALLIALGAARPRRWLWAMLSVLLGLAYADMRADLRLQDALPSAWEQRDIEIIGYVPRLPERLPSTIRPGQRFDFVVEQVLTPRAQVPTQLRLSWYGDIPAETDTDAAPESSPPLHADLQPGERWQLTVRLKRPHGNANPDGFDYEGWLFQHAIRATGYVRQGTNPARRLAPVLSSPLIALEQVRGRLKATLDEALPGETWPLAGVLAGLAIGDQNAITDTQWTVFNQTGTTHLMVVSGSHITLLAALLGGLFSQLWRRFHQATLRWPAQQVALLTAAVTGTLYAGLTGFGIPAQRTVLMLLTVCFARLSGRNPGAASILGTALMLVLLLDPWAPLAAGFWLSFVTVAALLLINDAPPTGWRQFWQAHWRSQYAATLATLPLLLLYFQRLPVLSPLANLLAIPLVSLIVTPVTLFGLLVFSLPDPISSWGIALLELAHAVMQGLFHVLELLASGPHGVSVAAPLWAILLAGVGVFFGLLPKGIPGRTGLFLLCPLPALFWPAAHPPEMIWWADVLDVGQGQAVLIRTAQHALLYDTGPRYGPPGVGSNDAAQRVILPYLRAQGVDKLDMLLISHRDSDHSGGSTSLRQGMTVLETRSSQPQADETSCQAGQTWDWDGVHFAVLHPPPGIAVSNEHRNALSCVLRIEDGKGRALLLPGDLPAAEERGLIGREPLSADWLLAAHHGSKTSSDADFLRAVNPAHILISAGYRNRFGHPHGDILARYAEQGRQVWRTDTQGALLIRPEQADDTLSWRAAHPRYWQDGAPIRRRDSW